MSCKRSRPSLQNSLSRSPSSPISIVSTGSSIGSPSPDSASGALLGSLPAAVVMGAEGAEAGAAAFGGPAGEEGVGSSGAWIQWWRAVSIRGYQALRSSKISSENAPASAAEFTRAAPVFSSWVKPEEALEPAAFLSACSADCRASMPVAPPGSKKANSVATPCKSAVISAILASVSLLMTKQGMAFALKSGGSLIKREPKQFDKHSLPRVSNIELARSPSKPHSESAF